MVSVVPPSSSTSSLSNLKTFWLIAFLISLAREPLGVIILEGCTVELAEEETEVSEISSQNTTVEQYWQVYAFKIQFHGDGKTMGRTYSLGTQTMEDLEQWMKLVRKSEKINKKINPGGLREL